MAIKPFSQRAAGVQCQANPPVPLKQLEQRQIAIAVGLLNHLVEVADGLMIVEHKDNPNSWWLGWARSGCKRTGSGSCKSEGTHGPRQMVFWNF